MRPRSKKHFSERYERVSPLLVDEPRDLRGRWLSLFGENTSGVHLEIGCGKGSFIAGTAKSNPGIGFVAMEVVPTVILMAMEKVFDDPLLGNGGAGGNVRFVCGDARMLDEFFAPGELDEIYLNFSDPWPRPKHFKNRLTHPAFLEKYSRILKPGGIIRQKTDNLPLFEYSVANMEKLGFEVTVLDRAPEDNVMTEYEARFTGMGLPIYRLVAVNHAPGSLS